MPKTKPAREVLRAGNYYQKIYQHRYDFLGRICTKAETTLVLELPTDNHL